MKFIKTTLKTLTFTYKEDPLILLIVILLSGVSGYLPVVVVQLSQSLFNYLQSNSHNQETVIKILFFILLVNFFWLS